jgi:hypothetical protein
VTLGFVSGVVVRIETGTLGPDRMVVRTSRCCHFRSLTIALFADQPATSLLLSTSTLVSPELGQQRDQITPGPCF